MGDNRLTVAIIDRLVHHGHIAHTIFWCMEISKSIENMADGSPWQDKFMVSFGDHKYNNCCRSKALQVSAKGDSLHYS